MENTEEELKKDREEPERVEPRGPGFWSKVGDFLEKSGLKEELEIQSAELLKRGIKAAFHEVGRSIDSAGTTFHPGPGASSGTEDPEDPYVILGVRRDAPMDVVDAAYRTLSRQAHPDVGGSEAKQQRLNIAHETIQKERGPNSK